MTHDATAVALREGPQHLMPSAAAAQLPSWVLDAHQQLTEVLFNEAQPFPCFFAPEAERRGELAYTWLSVEELDEPTRLHEALAEFLETEAFRSNRAGLAVFCQLGPQRCPEASFWSLVRHLIEHDPHGWPEGKCADPDNSDWGFHYRGTELFINAHSARHRRRRSRNAVVDLMLVVQRSSNFRDLIGMHQPSRVQLQIRKKLGEYDALPLHQSLEIPAGDPRCRAWKQFWVPDDNEPDHRRCPLSRDREGEDRS